MNIHDELKAMGSDFKQNEAQLIQKPDTVANVGFKLVPLSDLLSRPEVPTDWILDGMLAAGTVSAVVAKPKAGKSTLARGLCMGVAKGEEFLGRPTKQGRCIYLALEERAEEVIADFRAMGADTATPIEVHADPAPEAAIHSLVALVKEKRPVLVVIDPLFRMVKVRDEKAYSEVYAALGPLIDAARASGTHILLVHHSGKATKGDAIDSPLGSTAIGGSVSSLLVMKRDKDVRTIQTVQRIGQDMPETLLTFNATTRMLSVGGTRKEADQKECEAEILDHLQAVGSGEEKTEPEILERVEGDTGTKRKALRSLVEKGNVIKSGDGKKGSPYKYSFARLEYIAQTSKRESENVHEPLVNTEQMLVCGNLQNPPEQMLDCGTHEPVFDVEV